MKFSVTISINGAVYQLDKQVDAKQTAQRLIDIVNKETES